MTPVWPFGRHRERSPEALAAGSGAAGSGAAGEPGEPAVHRAEWRSLPPIQRAVTPAGGTFGTTSFEQGLTSRHNPGLLGTLGHYVVPDGPAGSFEAMAPNESRRTFAPAPGMVLPSAVEPVRELPAVGVSAGPVTAASLLTAPSVPSRPAVALQRIPASPRAEPIPVGTGTDRPPLVAGPMPAEPDDVPLRPTIARPPVEPGADLTPAAAAIELPGPVPTPSGAGAGEPPAPLLGAPPRDFTAPGRPPATSGGPPASALSASPAGEAPRRPGLGAPLPSGTDRLPAVQRVSQGARPGPPSRPGIAPPPPLRGLGRPEATGPSAPSSPASASSPTSEAPTATAATAPPAGAPPAVDDGGSADLAPLGLRRLPTMEPDVDAPGPLPRVTGDTTSVQRTASSLVTAPHPYPDALSAGPSGGLRTVAPLLAPTPPSVQRAPDPSPGSDRVTASRSLPAATAPVTPRTGPADPPAAAPLPGVGTFFAARPPSSPAAPTPIAAPDLHPTVQRRSGRVPTPGVAAPTAALAIDTPGPPPIAPPDIPVQTLESSAPSPDEVSAPPATPGPATMSERDVDGLARRLYPRLRDHLRSELRLDRERVGRASDLGARG